jgi:hypothetical protein
MLTCNQERHTCKARVVGMRVLVVSQADLVIERSRKTRESHVQTLCVFLCCPSIPLLIYALSQPSTSHLYGVGSSVCERL